MPHQTDIQEETGVTAAILDHLALHGATPGPGETDHRPLPQPDEVELAMATLFDTTIGPMEEYTNFDGQQYGDYLPSQDQVANSPLGGAQSIFQQPPSPPPLPPDQDD